jgi:predicted RNA-binding Zn-ribbon protein involved in translation (DUF1610 family)
MPECRDYQSACRRHHLQDNKSSCSREQARERAVFGLRRRNFVASLRPMAKEPLPDAAEVEIVCPHCGYHTTRTAGRLRRSTKVVCRRCGGDIVGAPPDEPEES